MGLKIRRGRLVTGNATAAATGRWKASAGQPPSTAPEGRGRPAWFFTRVAHEALAVEEQLNVSLLEHVELDAAGARPVREQPLVELEGELLR